MCKCTPRSRRAPSSQSKSQFLGQFLLGGLDLEVYLDGLLRATTKKGCQLFWQEKVHPRQNPGYAYGNMPKMRWVRLNEFCINYIRFPTVAKFWKYFTKLRRVWRWGFNFFYRHSLVKIEQASKIKLKSKYLNKDKKIHQRTFVRHFNEMRIVTKILMFLWQHDRRKR